MTRPVLPATRDERIALVRSTIHALLVGDDQLAPDHQASFTDDTIVKFEVQTLTAARANVLSADIESALVSGAGFESAVSVGTRLRNGEGWVLTIAVPVGAP